MKISSILIASVLIFGLHTSCKNNSETTKPATPLNIQKKVALKKVTMGIEGMTCEIGCAKTIESKISKTAGVTAAKVIFKENVGEFVFDAHQISAKEISEKISALGDGALYSVTEISEVNLN